LEGNEEAEEFEPLNSEEKAAVASILAEDPTMESKIGGTGYETTIEPWDFRNPAGGLEPAGALITIHLDEPVTWDEFEFWPAVQFNAAVDPTGFTPSSMELRGEDVTVLEANVSLVEDADGHVIEGSLVGLSPTTDAGGKYLYGPKMKIGQPYDGVSH
jgi:hypothetical protein